MFHIPKQLSFSVHLYASKIDMLRMEHLYDPLFVVFLFQRSHFSGSYAASQSNQGQRWKAVQKREME